SHVEQLRDLFPHHRLIISGDFGDEHIIARILAVGADAYVSTQEIPDKLMAQLLAFFPTLERTVSTDPHGR
ncbi:MAG: hypothetical protein AAFV07_16140, partial [Bacteroidota bacterium]